METLTHCPSTLQPNFDTYSPLALKKLFDSQKVSHFIPYTYTNDAALFANNQKRTALSGTSLKHSMVVQNGLLKLLPEKKKGYYILKLPKENIQNISEYSANENLTMQIASQIFKIETPPNGLCFFQNGEMAYFVRRFDVAGKANKYRMEDFATLAGVALNNHGAGYKYKEYSYEEVAELIKTYLPAWRIELLKFYRVLLFNFLFSNGNAHLKKFSVLETKDGDFRLAPAYGLLNTRIHGNEVEFALDKGLFKEKNRSLFKGGAWAIGATFRAFGLKIGLPEKMVDKELTFFKNWHPETEIMVNNSFLSDTTKKVYFAHYRLRRRRLVDMEL